MNAEGIAAAALLQVRTALDSGAPGNHRADALGALLALMSDGVDADWVRIAVAELWRGRQTPAELRACVDECLGRAHAASISEVPRRSTILPPPSGRGDEEQVMLAAARSSLPSLSDIEAPESVAVAYTTRPVSANWWIDGAGAEALAAG